MHHRFQETLRKTIHSVFPSEDKKIIAKAIVDNYDLTDIDFGEEFEEGFQDAPCVPGSRVGKRYPPRLLNVPIEHVAYHEVLLRRIQHNFSHNPRWMFDQPFDVFIRYLLFLTNQSYGSKLEDYFMQNYKKVKASDEKGDRYIYFGQCAEVKTSVVTEFSRSVNFNYIRTWQEMDKYLMFVVDNANKNKLYLFELSSKQMSEELEILKARPVNGTKRANEENKKEGLKISFKFSQGSKNFVRWMEKYRAKSDYFLNPSQHGHHSGQQVRGTK